MNPTRHSDNETLVMYCVYFNPSDYPGLHVVRKILIGPGGVNRFDDSYLVMTSSLDLARAMIPKGLVRFDRHPHDDPVIVETWL